MKSIQFIITALLIFSSTTLLAQTAKKETIKVWGNCNSCKKHIENAALTAGATSADWNKQTKMLDISYNSAKVSDETIQKAIAAAGYDTQKFKGDEKAYKNLDECCQYDRKKDATFK